MKRLSVSIALIMLLTTGVTECPAQQPQRVQIGIETLLRDSLHLVAGRRIGIVCNNTSLFPNGIHLADSMPRITGITVTALFTPEHGFTGSASAGASVASGMYRGIPMHSLYGKTRKPTSAMLKDIDVLLFDIQDVGARFYTYISTMRLCMEATAAAHIPIIICDRPNPIRGDVVQGPVLDMKHKSFVGMYPIPVRHGLTVCELARMIQGEGWLAVTGLELHSMPMYGWDRAQWYDETGLPWHAPSPNLRDMEAATLYPGTCFMEGTSLSEGRGTDMPFKITGAPFLHGEALATALTARTMQGVRIEPLTFTPAAMTGAASPKYHARNCSGIRIFVIDRDRINPIFTGLEILSEALRQAPDSLKIKQYFSLLAGRSISREQLMQAETMHALFQQWDEECLAFQKKRNPYLLYR